MPAITRRSFLHRLLPLLPGRRPPPVVLRGSLSSTRPRASARALSAGDFPVDHLDVAAEALGHLAGAGGQAVSDLHHVGLLVLDRVHPVPRRRASTALAGSAAGFSGSPGSSRAPESTAVSIQRAATGRQNWNTRVWKRIMVHQPPELQQPGADGGIVHSGKVSGELLVGHAHAPGDVPELLLHPGGVVAAHVLGGRQNFTSMPGGSSGNVPGSSSITGRPFSSSSPRAAQDRRHVRSP